jgi:hypothetical protein
VDNENLWPYEIAKKILKRAGGKATVTIDGGEPVEIDTYSADEIWGVCVFRTEFDTIAPHRIGIRVSGERHARAKDSFVHIDGIRVGVRHEAVHRPV